MRIDDAEGEVDGVGGRSFGGSIGGHSGGGVPGHARRQGRDVGRDHSQVERVRAVVGVGAGQGVGPGASADGRPGRLAGDRRWDVDDRHGGGERLPRQAAATVVGDDDDRVIAGGIGSPIEAAGVRVDRDTDLPRRFVDVVGDDIAGVVIGRLGEVGPTLTDADWAARRGREPRRGVAAGDRGIDGGDREGLHDAAVAIGRRDGDGGGVIGVGGRPRQNSGGGIKLDRRIVQGGVVDRQRDVIPVSIGRGDFVSPRFANDRRANRSRRDFRQ